LQNDTIVAVSLGEEYAGPAARGGESAAGPPGPDEGECCAECAPSMDSDHASAEDGQDHEGARARPDAPQICGHDDIGRFYSSLDELWDEQNAQRASFYAANSAWWDDGGYNGSTDEAAMIGDEHSEPDLEESSRFLDSIRREHAFGCACALDAGAGVGRVTKRVLLKRFQHVHLVEGCETWSRQSRRYLGKKRALSCTFTNERLEDFKPKPHSYDLIWVQWTLQYLTDEDVIACLRALKASLRNKGVMVLKENRPYLPDADHERFQMDTPGGEHGRFDITRPDAHHRHLFMSAGLDELHCHRGEETNTWVLR
jgi:SAM-dependent methyltransferase